MAPTMISARAPWFRIPRPQISGVPFLCTMAVLAALAFGEARPAAAQSLVLEPVASGLPRPVDIAHAGDGSGRLFFALQGGRIVIHDGSGVLATPFLDIATLVTCCGEQGLLGLAFHPGYAANGLFYVNYIDRSGDTVVARYQVSADPNRADPASASILLTVSQPFGNHNGGQIHFGPDGFLYIASGDGGSGGDPGNRAQDLGTLLGKMLRIDVDGGTPFAVPPDNPFVAVPGARPEIWAYGLRNPFRFSFDRSTGDLFIGDVGQNSREEIDFQPAGSAGGENYGWRLMEGGRCFDPPSNCNNGSLVLPIVEYGHGDGDCSVTGGYRYRGRAFPQLDALYFYADFCTGRIWAATRQDNGSWTAEELLDTANQFSTFGEDEDGELYVAHLHDTNGIVFRIVAEGPRVANDLIASFPPGDGLWARLNNTTWKRLHGQSPDSVATGRMDNNLRDEVIADFGASLGLWIYRNDRAWQRLHGSSAQGVVTGNLDAGSQAEVVVDFGPTLGLWARFNDSSWVKLNGSSPGAMTTADMDDNGQDELIADFGALGLWIWRNNSSWQKLHGSSPQFMTGADLDSDGRDEVIVNFGPPLGLWARFNDNSWVMLNGASPEAMTAADMDGNAVDELVADFGALGLWVWRNNSVWQKLHGSSPEGLATADLDRSGEDEVVVDFGLPLGLWARFNDSSWVKLNGLSPQAMESGGIDGD